MKTAIACLLAIISCQLLAQYDLTKDQWEQDLRFIQETVHTDYPFLVKKTTAEEFDKAVEELSEEIPNLESHEIVVGLARLISSFKYGHTALGFRHHNSIFRQLPVNFYLFKDGLYIQGAHKDYEELVGAKVIQIGSMKTADALEAIYPVPPNENDQYFKAYGLRYLSMPAVLHAQKVIPELSDDVEIIFEKEGKTFTSTIEALPSGETMDTKYGFVTQSEDWVDARDQSKTPYYLKNLDKIYYYEYLPEEKTVYVRQSQIQDDPEENIPAFYEKVFEFIEDNEVERLVLDVRLNGGGNNYKNKAVVTGVIETEKINQVGKFIVIIGRRTFSACQNLINELDNYTNVVFVGEPSSENVNFYGDNNRLELPNSKIPVFLSFAWWQDKPQWEGAKWTAPHVAVDMTFEEYKNNDDPALKAALNFEGDNFVLDPMGYLTDLFIKGDMEKVQSEAARMVNNPQYQFFNFEGEFNKVGYRLLNQGRSQEAVFVFQMNTQLFPDSANTWDSLAEAYLKAGDKDKAIELYNKALKMDPEGVTGENAKRMLEMIESHPEKSNKEKK
ncbi:tetratricopeptide repeat protein [Portibacter marinus]|uniref:tetratricopeptide repeat protein n=1 Tax=Portibacter marinus TaxID=2898660 RepID=UPI001F27C313|nr:tetratricopeptide repeat protein [Portibacter marinus]